MQTVNGNDVTAALVKCDTGNFERFGQAFYAGLVGKSFIPLGGMHDGGAEGFFDPEIFGDVEAKHFLQVSKQVTYPRKIRNTVKRLREYGRDPSSLVYVTSIIISDIDITEEMLSDELGCRIKIRDGKYIETQINNNEATVNAFESYLRSSIAGLGRPGNSVIGEGVGIHADKTLAVFLRQEVERRAGKVDLLESVADSLIIWSMSETDPEAGILMSRDEILAKIEATLPSSKQFIRGVIDARLDHLRSRSEGRDRQIRVYAKEKKYCLPYETRLVIQSENTDDICLKTNVSSVFERRLRDFVSPDQEDSIGAVVEICHTSLEKVFEVQGLLVAKFIHNETGDDDVDELYGNVSDIVAKVIDAGHYDVSDSSLRTLSLRVLRGTFYDSTPEERSYLQKLSHTYVLLFLLKNEPKIVEYFKTISSKFVLYVGTDFLVRALSEHYLTRENKTTQNLFDILRTAGSTLILTPRVVNEIASHLRAQIFEFENLYQHVEHKIDADMVEYVDRLLIRSYLYSRLSPFEGIKPPSGWRSYIEQFASYDDIKNGRGDDVLARYLTEKFGLTYEPETEMMAGIDAADVEELTGEILRVRSETGRKMTDKKELLAENDALQVLRVYKRRDQQGEDSPSNPVGFRTWWLTQDPGVRRASAKVVASHRGQLFMMRPEFLLNFIAFAPPAHEVMESYRAIFPTALGVRLANRLHARTFKEVMQEANRVWETDEARAASMITECVNRLKGDNTKIYENKWQESI